MPKDQIEHASMGPTAAASLLIDQAIRDATNSHHTMPLLVALQFWSGDKRRALRLARLLADIEPRYRDDFMLVLAMRHDVEITRDIWRVSAYCTRKFPATLIRSAREGVGYPDGCNGLFAGTLEACWQRYAHLGLPYHSVFLCEPDGVPLRMDWVDHLKRAHEQTLLARKFVTGARVLSCGLPQVTGTTVIHLPFWFDHPSLHRCPSGEAWDSRHGTVLSSALGPMQAVCPLYGSRGMSENDFVGLSREHAWLASAKDDQPYRYARKLLTARKGK